MSLEHDLIITIKWMIFNYQMDNFICPVFLSSFLLQIIYDGLQQADERLHGVALGKGNYRYLPSHKILRQ